MEQKVADRRRKIALYIAVWVAAVLILTFLLYRALGLSTVRAQTVTAVRSVEYKIARLDGYIFRESHDSPTYCILNSKVLANPIHQEIELNN